MYILFGGDCYYAKGGANDLLGTFDNMTEAIAKGQWLEKTPKPGRVYSDLEWWHVFCTETLEIVAQSDVTPHGVD